jgi:hypothetical protein
LFDAPLPHFRLKDAPLPPTLCPHCNKNLALVGLRHNCVVNNDPVVNTVVNRPYPNTEKRRAYMRDYMRKKRVGAPST